MRPFSQPCRSVAGRFGALFAALFLAASGTAQAATVNARSPSFFDVSTAVASAANGDTVIVPAGTASWTTTLVINKPIWLVGQTTVSYTNETANDQTIILDDVSRSSTPPAPIIRVMLNAGDMSVEPTAPLLLIKGFTFRGSPNTPKGAPNVQHEPGICPEYRTTAANFGFFFVRKFRQLAVVAPGYPNYTNPDLCSSSAFLRRLGLICRKQWASRSAFLRPFAGRAAHPERGPADCSSLLIQR